MDPNDAITIVTTTCAIPSQPSTRVIDEVYTSVRKHLPTARYLFLFDGVHEIQKDMCDAYQEYKFTLKNRMRDGAWINSRWMEFGNWHHQGGMIRAAVRANAIETPLIFWLEHDFPLYDRPILWQGITNSLLANEVCYIRFALPEESYVSIRALNTPTISAYGIPLMRTMNYSSLPNVCRFDFLERLTKQFTHGRCHLECERTEGIAFHESEWRLALYTPAGELARFYSIDGRAGREKPPTEQ